MFEPAVEPAFMPLVEPVDEVDEPLVLPDGYAVFGACAIVVLDDEVSAAVVLAGDPLLAVEPLFSVDDDEALVPAGGFIALFGAGVVLCAVCELVEPPEAESAEPLWPLDCA